MLLAVVYVLLFVTGSSRDGDQQRRPYRQGSKVPHIDTILDIAHAFKIAFLINLG